MKKTCIIWVLHLLLLLSFPENLMAQNCNCNAVFNSVKYNIEKNYAGFADKVNSKNRKDFDSFTEYYISRVKNEKRYNACNAIILQWLSFFKDKHIQFGYNQKAEQDSILLKSLYDETEIINLKPSKVLALQNAEGIEGVYSNANKTYKIAIVKRKTTDRDYAGIIIESAFPTWKVGQVKLNLKQINDSVFETITYLRNHILVKHDYNFDGNSIGDGEWIKLNSNLKPSKAESILPISSKKISEKTFYLKIGSFDERNLKAIDSVLKQNDNLLKTTPNLIIDLRGNSGGSDYSYLPIIPYLYTNPIISIGADVLASKDNINGWLPLLNNSDFPQEVRDKIKLLIDKMKANVDGWVTISNDDTLTFEKVEVFPKKVAILIDKGCGSSTEEFLLSAIQSSKVILMGQSTAGVLDYSNMREITPENSYFILFYPTSKSRRINIGKGIDNIGIKPNVTLKYDQDWIMEAKKLLEQ